MNANPDRSTAVAIRPPKIIPSLAGGFNAVANNIHLILIPVALDLLLWFGPHLRLKELLEPALISFLGFMRRNSSVEMAPMLDNMESLWTVFLERFNMTSLMSTFPVGVPAIMAGTLPAENPLGEAAGYSIDSIGLALMAWLALTLLGYGFGTFYFASIAQCCSGKDNQVECEGNLPGHTEKKVPPMRPYVLAWQMIQLVGLVIFLIILLIMLLVPSVIIASFVALLSPFLAQLALLMISFGLVWFLVPLIFSPHGIFMCGQNVFNSVINSTRLVRFSLSGTGLFLLVIVVLYQGMTVLWRVPPEGSWMALVGIAGHAFITTGLLAASFIYYRNGLAYIQSIRKLALKNS
jgi:hypothetical protein